MLNPPTSRYDIPAGQDRDGNRYGEDFKGKLGFATIMNDMILTSVHH